jgi:N-acetylneuraminic acid mutarotase
MNLISGNRLLVYGGQNRSSFYNEVWIQDTDQRTWSQLTIPNLPVLAEHSTALVGDKLYILGGHNMGIYNQSVFCLDTTTWQASELRPTGGKWVPRSGHSVVPVGNKLYIFGGNVYTSIREHKMHNDLWVLDLGALLLSFGHFLSFSFCLIYQLHRGEHVDGNRASYCYETT